MVWCWEAAVWTYDLIVEVREGSLEEVTRLLRLKMCRSSRVREENVESGHEVWSRAWEVS